MNRYFYFNEFGIINFIVIYLLYHLNIGPVDTILEKQSVPAHVKQVNTQQYDSKKPFQLIQGLIRLTTS